MDRFVASSGIADKRFDLIGDLQLNVHLKSILILTLGSRLDDNILLQTPNVLSTKLLSTDSHLSM